MRCDTHINWKCHLPEALIHLGSYQGHMDPEKTMHSQYEHPNYTVHPSKYVKDIFDLDNRSEPIAPSLVLKKDLDGTKSPSNQGVPRPSNDVLNNIQKAIGKDKNAHFQLSKNLFSPDAAPTMGEFNNMSAPLFMDVDPKVVNKFKGIVFISMAQYSNDVILRHKKCRNTKFDANNDPAWHYQDRTEFEVLRIVKCGATQSPVESIDDLDICDQGNKCFLIKIG